MSTRRQFMQVAAAVIATPSTAFAWPGHTAEIQFTHAGSHDHLIVVPTLLNGKGPFPLTIDTGAWQSVIISEDIARKLSLPSLRTESVNGFGGAQLTTETRLESIAVGAAMVNSPKSAFWYDPAKFKNAPGVDGIIGCEFLRHFICTIDYTHNRLRLHRADHEP